MNLNESAKSTKAFSKQQGLSAIMLMKSMISSYWPTGYCSPTSPISSSQQENIHVKNANVPGIKEHLQDFSRTFCSTTNQSVEQMWASFKSAATTTVDKFVPSKMSSTLQTHPWADTRMRCLMRRKQRANWRARKQ